MGVPEVSVSRGRPSSAYRRAGMSSDAVTREHARHIAAGEYLPSLCVICEASDYVEGIVVDGPTGPDRFKVGDDDPE